MRPLGSCWESVLQSMALLVMLCWPNEAACVLSAQLLQVPFFPCRNLTNKSGQLSAAAGRTGSLLPASPTGQFLVFSYSYICTLLCKTDSWGGLDRDKHRILLPPALIDATYSGMGSSGHVTVSWLSFPKTIQGCLLRF